VVLLIFSSLTSKWTPWWKSCAILVFLSVLQKTERDQFIYIVDIEGNGNTNVVILVNILMVVDVGRIGDHFCFNFLFIIRVKFSLLKLLFISKGDNQNS
jgi:hypothetical protein